MRNMSRIRNTLRFQSPEERVLNGLLALVVIVLITVAVAKVRDDRVEAASTEVRGETITRPLPREDTGRTTTTAPAATTTTPTLSPAEQLAFALAVQSRAPARERSTTSTTAAVIARPSATVGAAPVTRPVVTTTTTAPAPPTTTSTSASPTTTTTGIVGAPGG